VKTRRYFAFLLLILSGCGGAVNTPLTPKAATQTTVQARTVISNIQTATGNWRSWVQLPPNSADCLTPCSGTSIEEIFKVADPSLSGDATMFELNPASPYADALFSAQLIGQNSPQTPDSGHTLLPTIHNFIYDSYFYVTKDSITQVLEFDISMYMNGAGMIWGTQCNHLGDGDWDIWDNVNNLWVSAGVPCQFAALRVHRSERIDLRAQQDLSSGSCRSVLVGCNGELPDGWERRVCRKYNVC
jgi:hypothetical protein